MKKFISAFLSILLVLSFVACDNEKSLSSEETFSSKKQEQQIFVLGETAESQNLRFTATKYDESDGDEYHKPKENNVFIGVEFIIENISQEEQFVFNDEMFECYIDDFKTEESDDARYVLEGDVLVDSIAVGKKIRGCFGVEAPNNWRVIEIHISNFWMDSKQEKLIFKIEKQ